MGCLTAFGIIGGLCLFLIMEHPLIFWGLIIFLATLFILIIIFGTIGGKSTNRSAVHYKRRTVTSTHKPEDFSIFTSSQNNVYSGKCDGDCANCPPHYGYRYGRWYYGHNHSRGCERRGNSASGGRD
jgi:hypothetical protein